MARIDIHPGVAAARGRVAALSRSRTDDDPEYIAARAELKRQQRLSEISDLEKHIRAVVAQAPPLTSEQRDRIASILHSAPVKV